MRWKRIHYQDKETIVTLMCDPRFAGAGEHALRAARSELEAYIAEDPYFTGTYAPRNPKAGAPEIVRRMCSASRRAGVGPMASVAGAFAAEAVRAMIRSGAKEAVADNGGDIALRIRKPVLIGLYAGSSPVRDLAFRVEPRPSVFGICTSSGTVGHSFSYGRADAAVVISENIPLADAAATALCNRVRSEADLESCFDFLDPIREIEGALVCFQGRMALWGDLPRLVRAPVDASLITRGRPDGTSMPSHAPKSEDPVDTGVRYVQDV